MIEILKIYTYVDGINDTPFPNADNQLEIADYTYTSQRMGDVSLTATIMYRDCLDDIWTGKEYVAFQGEKYFIKDTPSSSKDNEDVRYKHELNFVSERTILDMAYFFDVVTDETEGDRYQSNNTKVLFYGDIEEYVKRLNYSMEYSNVGYDVVIDSGIVTEIKLVSFEDKYISDAIQEIYNIFELPYYFVGKTIHVGYSNNIISTVFKYGIENSLLSITKNNANSAITTRGTGVGSSDNIPYYYPNVSADRTAIEAGGGTWITPSQNLMPPIYRESYGANRFYNALNDTYINPQTGLYYEFENIYDGNNPRESKQNYDYIKPSITGMTNATNDRIDQIMDVAFDTNDNDEIDSTTNEYKHLYFFVKLRKFNGAYGFNLFEQSIEKSEMSMTMTDGACNACNFVISVDSDTQKNVVQVDSNGNLLRDENGDVVRTGTPQDRQNDTENYEVWIALRKDDNTMPIVMPNEGQGYKPQGYDTFVLLGINLPHSYVLSAENKLKEAIIRDMADNNREKFTFSINFSRIFLQENASIISQLNENAKIKIEYNNGLYELYISTYTYKADKGKILPEITVDIQDTVTASKSSIKSQVNESVSSIGLLLSFFSKGSANTAWKLRNTQTLWGQPFNGTQNISGDLKDVGRIIASGNITTLAGISAGGISDLGYSSPIIDLYTDWSDNAPINKALSAELGIELHNTLNNKVDKVTGYGLSKNDLSDALLLKLNGIDAGANLYVHPTSGIAAGTYKSVTVDANGHVTAGSNPTTLAGYGIIDAASASALATLDANVDVCIGALAGQVLSLQAKNQFDELYSEYAHIKTLSSDLLVGYLKGNADTATKLATARTLWGQSFDGTAPVSGNMTGVGSVESNGDIHTTQRIYGDAGVFSGGIGDLGEYGSSGFNDIEYIGSGNIVTNVDKNVSSLKVFKSFSVYSDTEIDTIISTEVTNRNTAITDAINLLNVEPVGGTGKYISAISEANGKISATESDMPTLLSQFTDDLGNSPVHTHSQYMLALARGAENGVAPLDINKKIPAAYLYDYFFGQVLYGGGLGANALATLTSLCKSKLGTTSSTITLTNNNTAITGYVANEGVYYIVTSAQTFAGISFEVGDWCISNGSAWTKVDNTDAVASVAGLTGAISKASLLSALNVADGAQVNIIESVKLNDTALQPTETKVVNVNACTSITVPTGLSVEALTTGGLIAISLDAEYIIPTTANITQIETNISNHDACIGALAGQVLSLQAKNQFDELYSEYAHIKTLSSDLLVGYLKGNADTATKLATARTLWGRRFDGTENVSGNMTGVGSVESNGDIHTTQRIYGDAGVFSGGIGDLAESGSSGYNQILLQGTGNAVTSLSTNGGSTLFYNRDKTFSEAGHTHAISEIASLQSTLNAKEATIAAGTTAQYWRGDKSWQTLNTSAVSEGNNLYYTNARVKAYADTLYSVLGHTHDDRYYTETEINNIITAHANLSTTAHGLGASAFHADSYFALAGHNHSGVYQPLDADLTAIAGLTGTSGLLKKTAANTWALDTNTYLTGITKAQVEAVLTGAITSHTHNYQAPLTGTGFVKSAAGVISYDTNTYLTTHQTIYGLTIQKNGDTIDTYTPNSASKTINISDVASATSLDTLTTNTDQCIGALAGQIISLQLKNQFDELYAEYAHTRTLSSDLLIGALKGNADTATAFQSAQSIALTGDISGSASSTGGWSIATTIGAGRVTNAMLAGSIDNSKLSNSAVTISGKEVSLGGSISQGDLRSGLGLQERTASVNGSTYEFLRYDNRVATSFSVYAPTAAGSSGQLLISTGGTPSWVSQGSGGGIDADKLDTMHAVDFVNVASAQIITGLKTFSNDVVFNENLVLANAKALYGNNNTGDVFQLLGTNSNNETTLGYGARVRGYKTVLQGHVMQAVVGNGVSAFDISALGDINMYKSVSIADNLNVGGIIQGVGGVFAGGIADLQEDSWTTPTLTNGTHGTTYGEVRYRRIGTNVQIDGSFTVTISDTNGLRIFQLPTGYRPIHNMSMLMYNNSAGIWRCIVGTDGYVSVGYIYKISDGSLITTSTTCIFDKCIFPIN